MKKIYLVSLLACLSFAGFGQTTFNYTGSVQSYTVPAGVTSLAIDMAGAKGGDYYFYGSGGSGGRVVCNLAVTPGQVLYIYVGASGGSTYGGGALPIGGDNSGGGANGGDGSTSYGGAACGAATDIRTLAGATFTELNSRLIVAAGGGGGAYDCGTDNAGAGGGLTGGTGTDCGSYNSFNEGGPGTQTSGGAAGYFGGTAGAFGLGGNADNAYYGGGGGGGWYGSGGAYAGGGCGGSSYYGGTGVTGGATTTGYQNGDGYVIIMPLLPCSGTVSAGTAMSLPLAGGAVTSFTLSLSGATLGTGLTYQWQSSATGTGSWSDIAGATDATYTFIGITANTYYQCIVTCAASSSTSTSASVMVTYMVLPTCLPTSASWYSESGEIIYGADAFSIVGFSGSTLNDASIVSAADAATGYVDRTLSILPVQLQQGGSYPGSVTWGSSSSHQFCQVWIDFNDNGTFEPSEEVTPVSGYPVSQPTLFNISIPVAANTGVHLMRLRAIWEENSTDIGSAPAHCDPCLIDYGGAYPDYWSGDIVDYVVNIVTLPPCAGMPTAGNATTSVTPVCSTSGTIFNLNITGTPASGLTYQWQSSPDSLVWTDILGATTLPYSTSESVTTYYRCVVTCTASGLSDTSIGVGVYTNISACYCIPSYYYSSPATYDALSNFSLTGYAGSTINDDGPITIPSSGYEDQTSISITLQQTGVYAGSITYNTYSYEYEDQVWIDFNDNGIFEISEEVTPDFGVTGCSSFGSSANFTLTVPLTATLGTHRMRMRQAKLYTCTPEVDMDPCNSISIYTGDYYYYGCTRDYTVTIIPPSPLLVAVPDTLAFGDVTVGTTSPTQSFILNGAYLLGATGSITVTAPPAFQVSSDGITWASSYTIPYTGATITSVTVYVNFNPLSLSAYGGNIVLSGGSVSPDYNVPVTGMGATACTGTPTAGGASITPTSGAATTSFTLSLAGTSVAGGLSFQWQSSSSSSGPWTNIAGATTAFYSFTGISASTFYQCIVTCPTFASATSSFTFASFIPVPACLPTSASWYSESGEISYGADAFSIVGFSGSTLSDASIVSAANPTSGYVDRTTTLAPIDLQQSGIYASSVTWGSTATHQFTQVWIDFNDDGIFQVSEEVSPVSGYNSSSTPQPTTFDISIPISANPGTHLMRMRGIWEENSTDIGSAPTDCDPCLIDFGGAYPDYWSGDIVDYLVNIVVLPPCAGMPVAGSATTSITPVCPSGTSFTLNITGTAATGLTYQWQSSPDSLIWTDIVGATTLPYSTTETATTFYRCIVTCTASGLSSTSGGVGVYTNMSACYCIPSYYYGSPATYDALSNFSLTGYSGSSINDDGPLTIPASGFEDQTSISVDLQQNGVYPGSITYNSYGNEYEAQVWIDFNDNGIFEISEEVTPDFGVTGCSGWGNSASYSMTIPLWANPGTHRMRVRQAKLYTCTPETDMDPCNPISAYTGDYYYYGCTRDYTANIIALPACTGAPAHETATSSATLGCPSLTFSLGLTGAIFTGMTYQWQSSTDSLLWADILGATTLPYSTSESAITYYRCIVTCTASGLSDTSHFVKVNYIDACYCIPSYSYSSPATFDALSNFSLTGYSGSSINDDGPSIIPASGFEDQTSISVDLQQNGVYSGSITYTTYWHEYEDQVWIDFNDNGTFEISEEVTPDFGVTGCGATGNYATYTLTIPLTATPGLHRMRVRQAETYNCTVEPDMDPCNPVSMYSGTYYDYGCTRDYTANIIALPMCAGTPVAGVVTASDTTGCTTYSSDLLVTGYSIASGLSYQWQSSTDGIIWANIPGATTFAYSASVTTTTQYRFLITCSASGLSGSSTPVLLSLTPAPGPINCSAGGAPGGPFAICYTASGVSFTGAATGGIWSNSPTTYGTVSSSTGAWTSFGSTGITTISYTIGSCTTVATLNINAIPPALPTLSAGTNPMCAYSTLSLTDATTGGVWNSSNTAVANVDASGNVTGTGNGSATIGYDDGCGVSTYIVTVNGSAITLAPASGIICDGSTVNLTATYLTDIGTSYSWSGPAGSSTTTALTITSASSTATGTYTFTTTTSVATGSCLEVLTLSVLVLPTPSVSVTPSITTVCSGTSTTVTSTTYLSPPTATILSQNFNTGMTGQVGGDWSVINTGDASIYNWAITSPYAWSDVSIGGDGTNFMGTNTDIAGSSYTLVTSLESPSFSTMGFSTADLNFNHYVYSSSFFDLNAEIDYSTDGGTTWTLLANYYNMTDGSTSWTAGVPTHILTLPSGAMSQPNVKLRWFYSSNYGYYWAVDNIVVEGTPIINYSWTGLAGATGIACSACSTATITPVATGVNVYNLTVSSGSCTSSVNDTISVNPPPPAITGLTSICTGGTSTLSNSVAGGSWSSSNLGIASVDPVTGVVTGVSTGSALIIYTLPTGCSINVTVNIGTSLPAPLTGSLSVCALSTSTLGDAVSGGFWTSSSTSVATIGSTTGIINGLTAGTTNITYTTGCGSPATVTITVIGAPAAITGTTSICVGAITTLADVTLGGTWSSSATGIADIGTSTGVIIGVAQGNAIISYATACGISTVSFNVNGTPPSIIGSSTVCMGGTTTLSDISTGGTWLSGNAGIAMIGSTTGIVMGMALGVDTITYNNGCGTTTTSITVDGLPAAITGSSSVCAGGTITLSDISVGGTWSSGSLIATVGSTTGIVTGGLSAGTTTITYTTGCGFVTTSITVNSATPASIAGLTSLCAGTIITLSDITPGGSWSSSATTVATIGSTGILTGIGGGITTVSYSTGCGVAAVSTITVDSLPSIISGITSICAGSNTTLTDSISGGTWSTSTTGIASIGSTTGIVTGLAIGVAHITYTNGCGFATTTVTVNIGSPSTISGATSLCTGSNITLSDLVGGGFYSTTSFGIVSIGSTTGVITGVAPGVAVVSYTTGCGSPATTTLTVNATPAAITGTEVICTSNVTTLADATLGGTWSNSATAVATINNTTGILTGITSGTTVVTYTTPSCGYVTTIVTVNGTPLAISGLGEVCVGGTNIWTDATTGGTWSTGASGIATVNASLGIVTGVSIGITTITYTSSCGFVTAPVTVNGIPAAINGISNLCIGSVTTLSDVTAYGTWTSGNPTIATIGTTTGELTGAGTGVTTITYSTGCGIATKSITVNSSIAISGTPTLCVAGTTSLTDVSPGGTWSSDLTTVATVDNITGVVTGVSPGVATIVYNSGLLCGSASIVVTVNGSPVGITGLGSVCPGSNITLSDLTVGGSWTSSNGSIATIDIASGVVSGVSAGTTTISYSTGCSAPATVTLTVTGIPAPITGLASVCIGNTTTLSQTTTGGNWASYNTSIATIDNSGVVTGITLGTVTMSYSTGCGASATIVVTVNGTPAAITGTTHVCTGNTTLLSDVSLGGNWTSDNLSIATVGSTTGIVTGVAAGTTLITYSTTCGFSTTTVTVNGAMPPISGIAEVCIGKTTTLYDTTAVGTWSSGTPGIASVNASGVVTGILNGTAIISYSNGCGADAYYTVTVNPLPATITGSSTLCRLTSISLSETYTGGTWSSNNDTIASVDATTGVVTGVNAGVDVINYTLTATGCTKSFTVTVAPLTSIGAIIGADTVCAGATIALSDSITGPVTSMVWTSSNTAIATVNTTGVVTGVSSGNATITYVVTGCSSSTSSKTIFVKTPPNPGVISGTGNICIGATSTLSSTVTGGTWSSNNSLISTVSVDVVTGLSAGTNAIIYTVSNNCGSDSITTPMTVLGTPAAITGNANVCVGSTDSLHNTTTGGIWTSSDLGTAQIDSISGLLTGIANGAVTITYSTGCGTEATTTITVNALPDAGTILGVGSVCTGSVITLTDASTGGSWISSNLSLATVSGGVVTGTLAGIDTIIYSVTTPSCGFAFVLKTITINPIPVVGILSGADSLCVGSNTLISASSTGGTWRISNANATDTLGTVTGVAPGIDTLYYTVSSLYCGSDSISKVLTIIPLPVAGTLTGLNYVCIGAHDTLTASVTGGLWVSSFPGLASVSAGMVTGIAVGIDTIKYSITNFCGTATVNKVINVDTLPIPGIISGLDSVCKLATISLSETVTGGTWSSTNSAIATVTLGSVTGVAGGLDTIIYSVTNVCGTTTANKTVFVNLPPVIDTITGSHVVCRGSTITLHDSIAGGTWINYDSTASVSAGVVTGRTFGIDTIMYKIVNTCGSATTTFYLGVDTMVIPAVTAGRTYVCISGRLDIDTLVGAPTGGTWSSSNSLDIITTSGHLTGGVAGIDTIMYSFTSYCGTATTSKIITVLTKDQCDSMLTVNTIAKGDAFIKIYPNPNNGSFTVELPEHATNASITVYDLYGKEIETREIKDNNSGLVPFNFNNIARGTYFVKVTVDATIYRGKVLIIE